jgi:hypothetical protein
LNGALAWLCSTVAAQSVLIDRSRLNRRPWLALLRFNQFGIIAGSKSA